MDNAKFRASFPEFKDAGMYPNASIDFWAELAEEMVGARWGRKREKGIFLFVAHNLVLARGNAVASAAGGTPGTVAGTVSSKRVGSVSVSYDTSNATGDPKAGIWNLTTYGQQYRDLINIVGAGCVQL